MTHWRHREDACYCDHQGERRQCTAAGRCLLTASEREPAHWKDYDEFMMLKVPPHARGEGSIKFLIAAIVLVLAIFFVRQARGAEPFYCKPLERYEKSCMGVKMAVATLGKERAISIAKKCGATDQEIDQATACLSVPEIRPQPEKQ